MASASPVAGKITEQPSKFTNGSNGGVNLGNANAQQAAEMLGLADAAAIAESFTDDNGVTHDGVLSDAILEQIEKAIMTLHAVLDKPGKKRIIMEGSGSSGRYSKMIVDHLNELICSNNAPLLEENEGEPIFVASMAGGAHAYVQAQERAEDSPEQGYARAAELAGDAEHVVVIATTAGLSANHSAGTLKWAEDNGHNAILIGFNPLNCAIDKPKQPSLADKEGNPRSLRDLIEAGRKAGWLVAIPIVFGAEPLSGSNRMISGTLTVMVQNIIGVLALNLRTKKSQPTITDMNLNILNAGRKNLKEKIKSCFEVFKTAIKKTNEKTKEIANLAQDMADTLKTDGHVIYAGFGPEGRMAFTDGTECPPTFGTEPDDIRGYIPNGWEQFGASEDLEKDGEVYKINLKHLEKRLENGDVKDNDLIVIVGGHHDTKRAEKIAEKAKEIGCKVVAVATHADIAAADYNITPDAQGILRDLNGERLLIAKMALNRATTIANGLLGKIFNTFMMNVGIANIKLFYRSKDVVIPGVIKEVTGQEPDEKTVARALIKVLYNPLGLAKARINKRRAAYRKAHLPEDYIAAQPGMTLMNVQKQELATAQLSDEQVDAIIADPLSAIPLVYDENLQCDDKQRKIHEVDPISVHVMAATKRKHLVPTATLIAANPELTVSQALMIIENSDEKNIKKLLAQHIKDDTDSSQLALEKIRQEQGKKK